MIVTEGHNALIGIRDSFIPMDGIMCERPSPTTHSSIGCSTFDAKYWNIAALIMMKSTTNKNISTDTVRLPFLCTVTKYVAAPRNNGLRQNTLFRWECSLFMSNETPP